MDKLKQAHSRYYEIHNLVRDGCKSSCGIMEVSKVYYYGEKEYYTLRFGGYCLSDCNRWHEIDGPTIDNVIEQFNRILDEVLSENEKER